jgi:hypothetical protein
LGWKFRNFNLNQTISSLTSIYKENYNDNHPGSLNFFSVLIPVSCNTINNCHPQAQCIYLSSVGAYECQCNAGYEGDGYDCSEIGKDGFVIRALTLDLPSAVSTAVSCVRQMSNRR